MKKNEKEKLILKKLERIASDMAKMVRPAHHKMSLSARKGGNKAYAVDIFLLGDAEIKRLKRRFLPGKKGPANVLSFAEPEGWPHPEDGHDGSTGLPQRKLGEVYLNADLTELKMDKLIPLLSHGVLHLLGYDHEKKNDRIKMEKMEEKISKLLNPNFKCQTKPKIIMTKS